MKNAVSPRDHSKGEQLKPQDFSEWLNSTKGALTVFPALMAALLVGGAAIYQSTLEKVRQQLKNTVTAKKPVEGARQPVPESGNVIRYINADGMDNQSMDATTLSEEISGQKDVLQGHGTNRDGPWFPRFLRFPWLPTELQRFPPAQHEQSISS